MHCRWVGGGRWVLIDLTAGGKDWGPALGGDGVVTHHSLPHLDTFLLDIKSAKDGKWNGAKNVDGDYHYHDWSMWTACTHHALGYGQLHDVQQVWEQEQWALREKLTP